MAGFKISSAQSWKCSDNYMGNKNYKTTEFLLISAETYIYPTTSWTVTGAPAPITAPILLAVKAGLKRHANESFVR